MLQSKHPKISEAEHNEFTSRSHKFPLGSSPGLCWAFQVFYAWSISHINRYFHNYLSQARQNMENYTDHILIQLKFRRPMQATRPQEMQSSTILFFIWKDILANSHNINHVSQLDFQNCWSIRFLFISINCHQVTCEYRKRRRMTFLS